MPGLDNRAALGVVPDDDLVDRHLIAQRARPGLHAGDMPDMSAMRAIPDGGLFALNAATGRLSVGTGDGRRYAFGLR